MATSGAASPPAEGAPWPQHPPDDAQNGKLPTSSGADHTPVSAACPCGTGRPARDGTCERGTGRHGKGRPRAHVTTRVCKHKGRRGELLTRVAPRDGTRLRALGGGCWKPVGKAVLCFKSHSNIRFLCSTRGGRGWRPGRCSSLENLCGRPHLPTSGPGQVQADASTQPAC